ncbi:hypothetical protein K445DRAFT_251713 [Daldinia sp. EC12]|nr:hypothetical protein F4774DRAFT_251152 [Daldinia eschscholtzii]OTB18522.1 hypothetical protein K445DRAFT_251713 [Daldinia sp. EC12]
MIIFCKEERILSQALKDHARFRRSQREHGYPSEGHPKWKDSGRHKSRYKRNRLSSFQTRHKNALSNSYIAGRY